MDSTDDNGCMCMEMSMVMTFGSWSDYELKMLFEGWDIQTKFQFVLSWIAVVIATVAYQGLKLWLVAFEAKMFSTVSKRSSDKSGIDVEITGVAGNTFSNGSLLDSLVDNSPNSSRSVPIKERIIHASVSALNYGFALMLMLVAMTYNPNMFVALLVGYFIGDIIFYNRALTQRVSDGYNNVSSSEQECH